MERIRIIGIETSCDETSVAALEWKGKTPDATFDLIAHEIFSQTKLHAPYGGVVPRIAQYAHKEILPEMVKRVLNDAGWETTPPHVWAVTSGPGLAPALAVGVNYARACVQRMGGEIVGVNHLEGHIASIRISQSHKKLHPFPWLALIISGGHTQLVLVTSYGEYTLLGTTRDDAVGESFDKVAKMLGIGYPGGPEVSRRAQKGSITAFDFPRPMNTSNDYDFSYAGLKTAVLYTLHGKNNTSSKDGASCYDEEFIADICASFEYAALTPLITKTVRAVKEFSPQMLCVVGGVSANQQLQERLCKEIGTSLPINFPEKKWTGDNAAMIAVAGGMRWSLRGGDDPSKLDIRARWPLSQTK